MPPGWPGCAPPADAAGPGWARAGPAEARNAWLASAARRSARSKTTQKETNGLVCTPGVRLLPAVLRYRGLEPVHGPLDRAPRSRRQPVHGPPEPGRGVLLQHLGVGRD